MASVRQVVSASHALPAHFPHCQGLPRLLRPTITPLEPPYLSGEAGGAMGDAGGHPLSSEQTQRSLWLGDLAPWMDENFLFGLFAGTNQLLSVKLIRNRTTGLSEGYAFLEFRTHEAADSILKTFNGQPIPGTDQVFRLNWAAYGVGRAAPSSEGEPPPLAPASMRHSLRPRWAPEPATPPRAQITRSSWGTWPPTFQT